MATVGYSRRELLAARAGYDLRYFAEAPEWVATGPWLARTEARFASALPHRLDLAALQLIEVAVAEREPVEWWGETIDSWGEHMVIYGSRRGPSAIDQRYAALLEGRCVVRLVGAASHNEERARAATGSTWSQMLSCCFDPLAALDDDGEIVAIVMPRLPF